MGAHLAKRLRADGKTNDDKTGECSHEGEQSCFVTGAHRALADGWQYWSGASAVRRDEHVFWDGGTSQ